MDFRKYFVWKYHAYIYMIEMIFVLVLFMLATIGCDNRMWFGLVSWIGVCLVFGFYYVICALNKEGVVLKHPIKP